MSVGELQGGGVSVAERLDTAFQEACGRPTGCSWSLRFSEGRARGVAGGAQRPAGCLVLVQVLVLVQCSRKLLGRRVDAVGLSG